MLALLVLVSFAARGLTIPRNGGAISYSIYETEKKIISQGYHAETHHVTTDDGYILEMHRIPYRRYQTASDEDERPVVFLMHGLLAASNSFIALGSEYSIGYNLADAGFDVWMGNARGNKNSRHHDTLDPDNDEEKYEFFDFSFEEIGMYDVAAMIDYTLEYTGRSKLHYIGHSQGGTGFLVLNSLRTEYNEKFASAHLLAAVGYQQYFPNSGLAAIAPLTDIIYGVALGIGVVELFPPNSTEMAVINYSTPEYCVGDLNYKYMCDLIGVRQIMRNEISDNIFDYEPAGAALKQIAHFGQNIRDKLFRRWNYGLLQNLGIYGSTSPPIYNLSLISVNVTMHYTINDDLLDERDVLAMASDMPNTIARKVARDTFLHADFVAAVDVRELVTEYIIESIQSVSLSQTDLEPDDLVQITEEEIVDKDKDGVENIDDTILTENVDQETELIAMTDTASGLVLANVYYMYLIIYTLLSFLLNKL